MKIQNALISNILDRSQRYFAHVTTVTLSWRVQNIAVIGRVYFTLECFEFSSNFEFDRNMLSGTGTRSWLRVNTEILVCLVGEIWQFRFCLGKKVTALRATRGEGGYWRWWRRLLCMCWNWIALSFTNYLKKHVCVNITIWWSMP